jgi:adenylate cyclase
MVEELRALIVGERRYSRAETSAASGVDEDRAVALWRAMGFAEVVGDDRVFTDRDVAALRTAEALRALGVVDDDGLLALTRTMAQALSRLALSHANVAAGYLTTLGDITLPEVDDAVHAAGESLLAEVAALIEYVWRRHLAVAAEGAFVTSGDETSDVAVGFADLVGFTELTRGLTDADLAALVERFERLAAHAVGDAGGRVVKTLGDEVMFTTGGAAAAAALGLALAESTQRDLGREVRVGIAYGPVVARLGDVFGPTVNIASRLTALAYPGTVLLDRGAATALRGDDAFEVSALRRYAVRGYSHLAPFRVRRAVSP